MASLSLGVSAYGLGGIGTAEPDVACRSLLGGAFTVNRSDVLPFAGRAMEADDGAGLGLVLVLVLARVYGCAASLAIVPDTVRAERRAGGMMAAVVGRVDLVAEQGWRYRA